MTGKTTKSNSGGTSGSATTIRSSKPLPLSFNDLFVTKKTYRHVANEFDEYHRHDVNVLLHLLTTTLGVWGTIQLAVVADWTVAVYVYATIIAVTTPVVMTAILHTVLVYACMQVPIATLASYVPSIVPTDNEYILCAIAIALGYGLQDLAHYVCCEPTYLGSYIYTKPWMLIVHSVWLLPLVIDAVVQRSCFLPHFFVSKNRCVVTDVANRPAVDTIRKWINSNIPSIPETTHVWPHKEKGTDDATKALEEDAAIIGGFRNVFQSQHYDIRPIVDMNEIYVTAVGAKKEINSDAVFYTPHTDGPYWFLPFCSCYRVLVGLTPNTMVRTRFNLQHDSQDQVVNLYGVLGFDYNRELHWIDHVPGQKNHERRSLMKLHYIVYPKGWHTYGQFCANLNTKYNTWARGNFLRTLRVNGMYEYVLAWWIWITTWTNALFEEYFGWSNLSYLVGAATIATYFQDPLIFTLATSFRHYMIYICTFAFGRTKTDSTSKPMIAHGTLMRDSKLYKTIALMHLGRRIMPLVRMPNDAPVIVSALIGFGITMLATARLGFVRTYFGSELGFVKPKWITGFPYGTIPHPMIVGQLFAFGTILAWFGIERLGNESFGLIAGHMAFYTVHMVQEMLTSSY